MDWKYSPVHLAYPDLAYPEDNFMDRIGLEKLVTEQCMAARSKDHNFIPTCNLVFGKHGLPTLENM
jgi:hypothetical protein